MSGLRNRFNILLAEKEYRDGRKWTLEDVKQETGIAVSTLSRLANNQTSGYSGSTISVLCKFLECSVGEFLEIAPLAGGQERDFAPVVA